MPRLRLTLFLLLSLVPPAWAATPAAGSSLLSAPLPVRNLAPVSLLYGLPVMQGARRCCEGLVASARLARVSNFTSANFPETQLVFDGETTAFDYVLQRTFGARGEWGLVLPLVQHEGGFLDRPIDNFHRTFGLPEGGRDLAPRNELNFLIRSDGVTAVRFRDRQRGFGDVRGWLGWSLLEQPDRALALRAQLKFPTGRVRRMTGSEGTDLAVWAELEERAALRALGIVVSAGAGAAYLGDGDLLPRRQESLAFFGHFGLRRAFGRHLALLAQLDTHSDLFDSRADALGGTALMGTLGFRVAPTPRFNLDFSLMEDLITRSSADVVFQLQLHAQL
ncbi:MAG: DUF3187 family protein [Pseudomonadota bacterium]